MKFYRYWIKCTQDIQMPDSSGNTMPMTVYGHSNISLADAMTSGKRLLDEFTRRLISHLHPWEYDADGRPIREEILLEISPRNIVTRNRYGAEVLNSTQLIFIDIDGELPAGKGFFGLFTKSSLQDDGEEALARVATLAKKAGHDRAHIRIYKTKAGFRLMMIGRDIEGKHSGDLMAAFHADPTYAKLCRIQDCYRARLTPKPFRLHIRKCHFNYPETDESIIEKQIQWLEEYNAKIKNFATCHYLGSINATHEITVNEAVRHHDERTHAMTNLPLA